MANFFAQLNPSMLTQEQQELLMAALLSNRQNQAIQPSSRNIFDFSTNFDSSEFNSENSNLPNVSTTSFNPTDINPLLESNFDYLNNDYANLGSIAPNDTVENPLSPIIDSDLHDKRKNPEEEDEDEEDDDDDDDHDSKRHESGEKVARKPGRKPLTTEPTTKRKAQNRAAQRAFRERKEKHVKDLETKVDELKKSSESVNHENGLLKAQIEKLTNEVKEYRRRLSSSSSMIIPSPSSVQSFPSNLSNNFNFSSLYPTNMNSNNPFSNGIQSNQDKFPSENSLLDSNFMNFNPIRKEQSISQSPNLISQDTTPSISDFIQSPHGSVSADSPLTNMTNGSGFNSNSNSKFNSSGNRQADQTRDSSQYYSIFASSQNLSPPVSANETTNQEISTLNSNSTSNTTSNTTSNSNSNSNRIFKFQSSSSASSSASPTSQINGASSSRGTSPEPFVNNASKDLKPINENNIMSTEAPMSSLFATNGNTFDGLDYSDLNFNQAKDPFAPMSWPDFRTADTSLFGGDPMFNGNFGSINDNDMFAPLNWYDLTGNHFTNSNPNPNSDTNTSININPDSNVSKVETPYSSIEEIDPFKEDSTLAKVTSKPNFVPCSKIWETIQNLPEVKAGSIDIEGLCQELKQKARCTEKGIAIEQKDVEEAVNRLPPRKSPVQN